MEFFDIYDQYRNKKNRKHQRGTPLKDGDYRLVVHIWIQNSKGEYLIQKRQSTKNNHPNMWDSSAGGSAMAGDESNEAAVREVEEELGIELEINEVKLLLTVKSDSVFNDVWFARKDIELSDLNLQYEEVSDAKWVTKAEIKQMIEKKEFVDLHYLDTVFEVIESMSK